MSKKSSVRIKKNILIVYQYINLFFLGFLFISCKERLDTKKGNHIVSTIDTFAKATSISVRLKPKTSLFLNGFAYINNVLKFENFTDKDSTITKRINIKSPTFLYHLETTGKKGNVESNCQTLLIIPGDSILIDDNLKGIHSEEGITKFLDKIISIPRRIYPTLINSENDNFSLDSISNLFLRNDKIIKTLSLNEKYKNAISLFNSAIRDYLKSKLLLKNSLSTKMPVDSKLMEELVSSADEINKANIFFKQQLFYNVITLNALNLNNQLNITNIWSYYDKVDKSISKYQFYTDYLNSNLLLTYKYQPKKLKEIGRMIASSNNPTLDSINFLVTYLIMSETDFAKAKENLNAFKGGTYKFIFNDNNIAVKEQKNIKNLKTTNLLDLKNNDITLETALKKPKIKLYVIDVWATWCIPCVAEFKPLQKARESLKDLPIKFISISIDKMDDIEKWKNSASKLTNKADEQFLLIDAESSSFRYFFNIQMIPRFIVIDSNGKVINDDFIKPSKPDFIKYLKSYLAEIK